MTIVGMITGFVVLGLSMWAVVYFGDQLGRLFGWATKPIRQRQSDRDFEEAFGYPRSLAVVGDYKVIFSDGAVQDRRMTLGDIDKWPVLSNEKFAADGQTWRVVEIQTKDGTKVWPRIAIDSVTPVDSPEDSR